MSSTAKELCAAGFDAVWEAAFRSGDFSPAQHLLDSARTQAGYDADIAGEASALDGLGILAHYRHIAALLSGKVVADDEVAVEERLFREALALHRQIDDVAGSTLSLFGLGLVHQLFRHDWSSAMAHFWEALRIIEERPGVDLYTRSEIYRHIGFYYLVETTAAPTAVEHLEISLDLRIQLGDPRRIPSGMVALAEAQLAAGNRARAGELLEGALAEARSAHLIPARITEIEAALREVHRVGADA